MNRITRTIATSAVRCTIAGESTGSSAVIATTRTISTAATTTTTTTTTEPQQLVRINKLLADFGYGSRRDADEYIRNGWVKFNDSIVTENGIQVPITTDTSQITVTKEALDRIKQKQSNTFILNKPLGIVSCQPYDGTKHHSTTAVQLLTSNNYYNGNNSNYNDDNRRYNNDTMKRQRLQYPNGTSGNNKVLEPYKLSKIATVGRLDINSTGLLLFTQCGLTARSIIGPNSTIEKEYLVRINSNMVDKKNYTSDPTINKSHTSASTTNHDLPVHVYRSGARIFRRMKTESLITNLNLEEESNKEQVQAILQQLREGIVDDVTGEVLTVKSIKVQNKDQFNIVLTSGKHHHIRRMLNAVQLHTYAIKRIRIGTITLGSLPLGQWRFILPQEQNNIL